MNMKLMMEFANSRNAFCEFPLRHLIPKPFQTKQDNAGMSRRLFQQLPPDADIPTSPFPETPPVSISAPAPSESERFLSPTSTEDGRDDWDPEPQAPNPESAWDDKPTIDPEGDDDSKDLGLLDPDVKSQDETPLHDVAREWDYPSHTRQL